VRSKPFIRVWPANLNWPPDDVSTGADNASQSISVRGVGRTSDGPRRQARVAVSLVPEWS
jgi:hypothetical protein